MANLPGSTGAGSWSYRSYYNYPDLDTPDDKLELATANLAIEISKDDKISGKIYGDGWALELDGYTKNGDARILSFRGKGINDGHEWIYDYFGYVIPYTPEGKDQVEAIVGSVVRVIPHPGGDGSIHPAGVVASFYAVYNGPLK